MESPLTKIGLLLLIMCSVLSSAHAQRSSQRKDELIQDTVRKFLGVKSDDRTTLPGKGQPLPPQYMMDLYEKYRSGHTPMQGNTVRSILAMRDKIADVDMLIFNLTGLKSTEQILQSKLYLLKRRRPKGGKKREHASFRLNIGCLPNMTSRHHIDISLTRQKPEWHSYDISGSVVSCRQTRKGKDSLLGLTLEIKRSKGNHRLVAFKRLVKSNSQPFVLIFSEDSQNQSSAPASTRHDRHDELRDLLRAKESQEGFSAEKLLPQTADRTHRSRRFVNYEYPIIKEDRTLKSHKPSGFVHSNNYLQKHIDVAIKNVHFNVSTHSHFVKLLHDVISKLQYTVNTSEYFHFMHRTKKHPVIFSHLREDILTETTMSDEYFNFSSNTTFQDIYAMQQMYEQNGEDSDGIHNSSKRSTRSITGTLRYSTGMKESNHSESSSKTVQTIDQDYLEKQSSSQYPKPRLRNKKRKMRGKRKKKGRNLKLPPWLTRHDSRLHAQDVKQMCRRKSLTVDFAKLGWDEWIITPKSFNAHYCEGSCTFPLIKHTDTSNHAAIQSLIQALGSTTNIPTPCCVPSVTRPLTLLYFDDNGNFVLKSYPDMIVQKCGCR